MGKRQDLTPLRDKRYEIVDALPENNYGKVLKKMLQERVGY